MFCLFYVGRILDFGAVLTCLVMPLATLWWNDFKCPDLARISEYIPDSD